MSDTPQTPAYQWEITTKSGSKYYIRREGADAPRYFLRANNVPNERFDKLLPMETEIYHPSVLWEEQFREPKPLWFDAVGRRLNFVEVFEQPVKLFPHGEIVCSRVQSIVSSEVA